MPIREFVHKPEPDDCHLLRRDAVHCRRDPEVVEAMAFAQTLADQQVCQTDCDIDPDQRVRQLLRNSVTLDF